MEEPKTTRVAIIAGARTPFVKAGTVFRQHSAFALAVHSVRGLLEKYHVDPQSIDELTYGIVLIDPRLPNLAREIVFKSGLPASTHALTVSNNCISGIHAISAVHDSIANGRAEVGIGGGVESMSNPAILFNPQASRLFLDLAGARTLQKKLGLALKLRARYFKPALPAIAEPSTGMSMGEHTELMAKEWKIPRAEQDEIAYLSHQHAHAATQDRRLKDEIHPLDGIDHDLLIRSDTSMEKLAKLPSVNGLELPARRPRAVGIY